MGSPARLQHMSREEHKMWRTSRDAGLQPQEFGFQAL